MNWLVAIAEFVVNEILAVPAYLIGIITAVGLIALRKSAGQVIGGALKATLGFLLIGALDPYGQQAAVPQDICARFKWLHIVAKRYNGCVFEEVCAPVQFGGGKRRKQAPPDTPEAAAVR